MERAEQSGSQRDDQTSLVGDMNQAKQIEIDPYVGACEEWEGTERKG